MGKHDAARCGMHQVLRHERFIQLQFAAALPSQQDNNRGVGLDGRRALAVPVYRDGELECVLGCWYPTVRANPKHRACIALNCRKTAGRISAALDAL